MTTNNPPVNRCLADKAMDHLDHALGRPTFPLRESYRNYFATGIDSALADEFDASPYWHLNGVDGSMAYFSVTSAGRRALLDHLEALPAPWVAFCVTYAGYSSVVPERSAARARYARYLSIADVCPDLTFIEFAREARVRRAA